MAVTGTVIVAGPKTVRLVVCLNGAAEPRGRATLDDIMQMWLTNN